MKLNHGFFASVKGILILIIFLAAIIPLSVAGIIIFSSSKAQLTQKTSNDLDRLASIQSQAISNWVLDRVNDLRTASKDPLITSMDPELATEAINRYHENWQYYEHFFIINPSGDAIASTSGSFNNYADRAYFKLAIQGEENISDALISKTTGNTVIVIASPIYQQSKVVGIIIATVPTTGIQEMLANTQIGNTGEAYLINSSSTLISPSRYTDQLLALNKITEHSEMELVIDTYGSRQVLSGVTNNEIYENYLDNEVIGAFTPVEGIDWYLLIEQSTDEAFSDVEALTTKVIWIMVFFGAVAIFAAVLISNWFAKPIVKITHQLNQLSVGEITEDRAEKGFGEIGILQKAYNQLSEYMKEITEIASGLADGDLTQFVTEKSEKDLLGNSLIKMIKSLTKVMQSVQNNSIELSNAMNSLAKTAEQSKSATEQIIVDKENWTRKGEKIRW